MIPKSLTREHIFEAINYIDKHGVPAIRNSRKFKLVYNNKYYPPKYVIAIASYLLNGAELASDEFGGGKETNGFLKRLGFKVINKLSPSLSEAPPVKPQKGEQPLHPHNERCPQCKKKIEAMLRRIFGDIKTNYRFNIGTLPEHFNNSTYYNDLNNIYSSLKNLRGFNQFVRVVNMPRVDYFIPNPGFIIEFDESQHFTSCRKDTLLNYPPDIKLGYNRNKWIELCDTVDAKDNDPAYRDEQRAWYDTLRDFLPSILSLLPTVRLYSKDYQWCSLNPDNAYDIQKFKNLMRGDKLHQTIEIMQDPNPTLGRVIIADEWNGDIQDSKKLLMEICDKFPQDVKINCLITCGAFLTFDWPTSLPELGNNKYPNELAFNGLKQTALNKCKLLLDKQLRNRLLSHTDYITIGIDSYKAKISLSNISIREPHVEFVVLVDLKNNKYHFTGKSYPTTGQEQGLVRMQDLSSHFVDLSFGKTMILGCHDLIIFSPRGKAVSQSSFRKNTRTDFYDIAKKEQPEVVLHHPHTTDSSGIWTPAWNELVRAIPTVKKYIGAGRYFRDGGQRSSIDKVLEKNKSGDTIDVIINYSLLIHSVIK